nr:hypothetical protein [uncultured archaeon]AQS34295.1 hypothetical protein [uncultured archaeon]AQS34736.1 hypothetical protein [uncultured archaeon]
MQPTYSEVYSIENLTLAWKKARENKTLHKDVIEFEKDLERNLLDLQFELKSQTYKPKPLTTFVLRDPKTRVISKSDFRDRVIHHALLNVIRPAFESSFFYDSCANQIGKGTLFAIKRFDIFARKATHNFTAPGFCLKADIKHYFDEVSHEILLEIIKEKIQDKEIIWLIRRILSNNSREGERHRGMPLGNYTSQFFANLYLHKFDHLVKHSLKAKYYIRYVDDFIVLHKSEKQLEIWKEQIDTFLKKSLKLELHPQKSKIINLYKGIDFVGFRNFISHKRLRKRNIGTMKNKIRLFEQNIYDFGFLKEIYQGWQAHASWANTHKLRKRIKEKIIDSILIRV